MATCKDHTKRILAIAVAVATASVTAGFTIPALAKQNGTGGISPGGPGYPSQEQGNTPEPTAIKAIAGRQVFFNGSVGKAATRTVSLQIKQPPGQWSTVARGDVRRKRYKIKATITRPGSFDYRIVGAEVASAGVSRRSFEPRTGKITVYKPIFATWFGGKEWVGNTMACGKKLTDETVAVAHPSLPCGTVLELYLKGKTIVAPVEDRCACTIDLTETVARHLGVYETGVATIGMRTLSK